MTKYLISFPAVAMDVANEDMAAAQEASHAVIREAEDAGVYVFGGGINEGVPPVMVAGDGAVKNETYPQTRELSGVFWSFRRARLPSCGPRSWPRPVDAHRNCASFISIRRAERILQILRR